MLTRLDGRSAADTAALYAMAQRLSADAGLYWDVWYGEHTRTFHALNAFTPRIWVWLTERDPEVLRAKVQQVNREWAAEIQRGNAP